jgi:molybdenum cofactor biosynthesis enzyme MoaA
MTGGEPTMWPQLIEFTDRLPESYILDISTNGSRTLRFWRDFSEKSKFQKVNISAHLADCDIEHLIESL